MGVYAPVWELGQAFVGSDELAELLGDGWEPFAVVAGTLLAGTNTVVHLRRKTGGRVRVAEPEDEASAES